MEQEQLVHSFEEQGSNKMITKGVIIGFFIVILLGIGTGYLFAGNKQESASLTNTENGQVVGSNVRKGQVVGSKDEKTFNDEAEGILKKGGIDGEGSYHLERPGGKSQNVYLTSSVVDMSQFENRKVRVWGQTNQAKKAGWLMDVGRLQVLE
ncbi:hypothetical protein C4577_06640 [Candidatus Parcubacteria bacterium]|nr:MAG: hypothetical protein C4577_06640 [Candidatus Parcubacteria bacterium]